jgi:flagellar motor switch protein FliM
MKIYQVHTQYNHIKHIFALSAGGQRHNGDKSQPGFAFLDRLLGGPGASPEKVRGLTEIEQTVMERLGQKMLDYLREPWESIIDIEPSIERVETNPQFTQLVSPSEVMIIVSLETKWQMY